MEAAEENDREPDAIPGGAIPPSRRLPSELHRALTPERLAICAGLLVRGRDDALALADPWAGDDAWSVGCRAYSFSRHQLRRAASTGRYNWLGILDESHHFVFLIEGVPVRFYRGDADDPSKRTLRRQENEAQQLALALGAEDDSEGLMFRLALETNEAGEVTRAVFLALRGEEGHVECLWPVPLPEHEAKRGDRRQGTLQNPSHAHRQRQEQASNRLSAKREPVLKSES